MSDIDNKPTLGRKPLGLKLSVQAGEVKQTFSHGRTNKVVVEVKRRKILGKPGEAAAAPEPVVEAAPEPVMIAAPAPVAAPEPVAIAAPAPVVEAVPAPVAEAAPAPVAVPAPVVVAAPIVVAARVAPVAAPVRVAPPVARPVAPVRRTPPSNESRQEMQTRLLREAEESRLHMAEVNSRREQENRQRALAEEARRVELGNSPEAVAAAAVVEVVVEAPAAAATPATSATEAVATGADAVADAGPAAPLAPRRFTPVAQVRRPEPAVKKPGQPREKATADRRQSGKLTVTKALNEDEGARARSLAALKRAREKEKRAHFAGKSQPREKQVRDVVVPETITLAELANRMAEKATDLVKVLFKMGITIAQSDNVDQDTAELLVEEFGHNIVLVSDNDVDIDTADDVDADTTMVPRPAVVTIMGHVDHGKTSLLDALRGTDVVRGEAGGITQHIGAYQIKTKSGELLTVIDTPGHEAFTEMRQRGANVTDIVVLVVAADDGIMPQTIEAINHTKAAGVPMIVAINKIDKPEANAKRIRERLLEHEVVVEEMSGDVQDVEVSAKTGAGLDLLIEKILLQAELLELRANPDRLAEAAVIEAKLDKGKGPLATVLITRGTLKVGDILVVGTQSGRVRAMLDDKGRQVKAATPSMAVEVLGLSGVPMAGDTLTVVESEARAREVAAFRHEQATAKRTTTAPASLENMFSALTAKQTVMEYAVVVKADVQGTTEAIVNALNKISTDLIKVKILSAGVGAITESDVTLAGATGAPIVGFNVRPNPKAREMIARHAVRLKYFDVIYQLTDDIRKEMAGELGPERIETVVGRAEVKDVFPAGKHDKAAGLLVLEGYIRKGLYTRLTRNDVIVSKTHIKSLRRFKDDVAEVRIGLECGVVLEDTNDIKPGDTLETFEVEMRERTL